MASITDEPNGHRTIQFVGANHKRKSIRLGKISKRQAESVRLKVEMLMAAKFTAHAPDDETSRWLAALDDDLYDKLAKVGLVMPRTRTTLDAFIDKHIVGRTDIKPRTRDLFQRTQKSLISFFGIDKPLRDITKGDAKDFRAHLLAQGSTDGKPLGVNTVNDRCRKARQFFNCAIDHKVISENPFVGLPGTVKGNEERLYFVSRNEVLKVLDACPDNDWRLLVALCRFGGLRNPSETFTLRWTDVNWAGDRITVHSPKTEHHEGKETREIPIFSELRPYLEEAWEQAATGSEYVITRWRSQEKNLRTQLHKIIRRAGLTPWPKTFQNLRSTRQTELEEEFPSHVVCAWIGNSERVARAHYLQVTDDHFARGAAFNGALQNPVQQAAAGRGTMSHGVASVQRSVDATSSGCETLRKDAARSESSPRLGIHPSGLEPLTFGSVDRCSIQLS